MSPLGLPDISLKVRKLWMSEETTEGNITEEELREIYISMLVRTSTPNKFSPPNPMTIALSARLVLLQMKHPE